MDIMLFLVIGAGVFIFNIVKTVNRHKNRIANQQSRQSNSSTSCDNHAFNNQWLLNDLQQQQQLEQQRLFMEQSQRDMDTAMQMHQQAMDMHQQVIDMDFQQQQLDFQQQQQDFQQQQFDQQQHSFNMNDSIGGGGFF